jgi:lipid A 3-O-deacylase
VRLPGAFHTLFSLVFFQTLLLFTPTSAQGHDLQFRLENDCFSGNADEQYTHGTRVTWISPVVSGSGESLLSEERVPGVRQFALSLGHAVFTPEDKVSGSMVKDDRPYAGWSYLSGALRIRDRNRQDVVDLQLGIVGPNSHAEGIQNVAHGWLGFPKANGWDNQLENEPGLLLAWERTWLIAPATMLQVLPHVSLAIGNVETFTGLGAEFRTGHLPDDFGGELIRPARLDGGGGAEESFGLYLFLGAEGRAVAHTIFLDGNTFKESHSVDKQNLVADLYAGLGIILGRLVLSYAHVYRSEEFKGQDGGHIFGSLRIGWSF